MKMGDLVVKLVFEVTEDGKLIVGAEGNCNAVLAGLSTLVQRVAEQIGLSPDDLLDYMKHAYLESETLKDSKEMQDTICEGLKIFNDAKKYN